MDAVHIRFTRYSAFYAPLLLAMGGEHLRDEGIETTYDTVSPERSLEDGVAQGEVQVGQSAVAAAFVPQAAGELMPYRHFALMNARDGFFVAARAGSGIEDWQGLEGRALLADHYFQPLGMLRMWALLSSLGGIAPELVFCFATGNTARLRRLNSGLIEPGRDADFVFLDRAQHTAGRTLLESVALGDIPGVGMVMIDGLVRCGRSRNTPPATEIPVLVEAVQG